MAILLPIIRLLLLWSNCWITFKALRAPDTRRTDGAVSIRSVQGRRRILKSCLSVWIVWSVGTLSERVADSAIGFLPFYSEGKTLSWFILLVTRTMLSEPIVTNLLHPTIKPHTPAIDSILDLLKLLSDLLVAIVCIPFLTIHSWWSQKDREAAPPHTTQSQSDPVAGPAMRTRSARRAEEFQKSISRGRALDDAQTRQTSSEGVTETAPSYPPSRYARVDPNTLNFGDDLPSNNTRLRARRDITQLGRSVASHSAPSLPLPRTGTEGLPAPSLTSLRSGKIARGGQSSRRQYSDETVQSTSMNPIRRTSADSDQSSRADSTSVHPSIPLQPQPHRSISQPLPTPDATAAEEWAGTYPPLPSAYPATPIPSRPMSLPSEPKNRITSLPILTEMDPPFAGAYPFTPPSAKPLELHQAVTPIVDLATHGSQLDFQGRPGPDNAGAGTSGRDVETIASANISVTDESGREITPAQVDAPKSALANYRTKSRVPKKRQLSEPITVLSSHNGIDFMQDVEVIDLTIEDSSDGDKGENEAPLTIAAGQKESITKKRRTAISEKEKASNEREVLKPVANPEPANTDKVKVEPGIQTRTSTRRTRRR